MESFGYQRERRETSVRATKSNNTKPGSTALSPAHKRLSKPCVLTRSAETPPSSAVSPRISRAWSSCALLSVPAYSGYAAAGDQRPRNS